MFRDLTKLDLRDRETIRMMMASMKRAKEQRD